MVRRSGALLCLYARHYALSSLSTSALFHRLIPPSPILFDMTLLAVEFERCLGTSCNAYKLRNRVAVSVTVRTVRGIYNARALSRSCDKCRTQYTPGMTTYKPDYFVNEIQPWVTSALPIPAVDLDAAVGVRAHSPVQGLVRVSNHHFVDLTLARSWYLQATMGRSSTESQALVRAATATSDTLLDNMDGLDGVEEEGGLGQLIWASIVFYGAFLFEQRRGCVNVAWLTVHDVQRTRSSLRTSLHALCRRMVGVWQRVGFFHARHECDRCRLFNGIDYLVGDGVAMGGIVCGMEGCLDPPVHNLRFCVHHSARERVCAVVRVSSSSGPCGEPRAPRAPSAGRQAFWLVCRRHIPLEEAHERRANSAATRRNGSVPGNVAADAAASVDGDGGDQFGAHGGGPGSGLRAVWRRQHVQRYVVFSRPCGVVVFAQFLSGGEGPATVLASMARAVRCLERTPSAIGYDMCCRIHQHLRGPNVVRRDADTVAGAVLVVPRFHERTHRLCAPHCMSSCRMSCYPELVGPDVRTSLFNTSRAEQHFRFLRGWQNTVHSMHCDKADFMLGCVEEERNFDLLRR